MAFQFQTLVLSWEALLKKGWAFHSHVGVSTWRRRITKPKGCHFVQSQRPKIEALHRGRCTEWRCCFHRLDGSHLPGLEEFFLPFLVFDFFADLVCLVEDVKLSANGRQPTLLTLLLLIS
jgi:hypothetical protein